MLVCLSAMTFPTAKYTRSELEEMTNIHRIPLANDERIGGSKLRAIQYFRTSASVSTFGISLKYFLKNIKRIKHI